MSHPDRPIEVRRVGDLRGHWDEDRLGQVLSNLVGNAVRHGVAGTAVTVHLDGEHAHEVELAVINCGEIQGDVLPHVFKPFRAGRARTREQGLGLGLFIVSQVISAHGGSVEASSREGCTAFRVRLPRASGEPSETNVSAGRAGT